MENAQTAGKNSSIKIESTLGGKNIRFAIILKELNDFHS